MTKTTETKKRSADEIIDKMLEDFGMSREAGLGEKGLWGMRKKQLLVRALAGELTHHWATVPGRSPRERKISPMASG